MKNYRQCPSCGGCCGHTKKKGCQYVGSVPLTNEELVELGNMLTATKIEDTERINNIALRLQGRI